MGDKQTMVDNIPPCNICAELGISAPAYADAKLMRGRDAGPWAYVCKRHFDVYGCGLGLGKGQKLLLRREKTS